MQQQFTDAAFGIGSLILVNIPLWFVFAFVGEEHKTFGQRFRAGTKFSLWFVLFALTLFGAGIALFNAGALIGWLTEHGYLGALLALVLLALGGWHSLTKPHISPGS